jgi:hypothetical protein
MELSVTEWDRRGGPYHVLDGLWCDYRSCRGGGGGVLCPDENHEKDVTMDFNKFRRWVFWLGMFGVIFMVGMLHTIGHHLGVFR